MAYELRYPKLRKIFISEYQYNAVNKLKIIQTQVNKIGDYPPRS